MAFREVAMFEVKEVIRLFGEGMPKKAIARVVCVDPKTVRSDVAAAERLGLAGLLDDDGLARLLRELRIDVVERPRGEAWRRCEEHRDAIKKWLDDGVKLTKVRKLLERRGVFVPYPTLHRFAAEELEFGRGRHSVRDESPTTPSNRGCPATTPHGFAPPGAAPRRWPPPTQLRSTRQKIQSRHQHLPWAPPAAVV